jgi:hypothetical protein
VDAIESITNRTHEGREIGVVFAKKRFRYGELPLLLNQVQVRRAQRQEQQLNPQSFCFRHVGRTAE